MDVHPVGRVLELLSGWHLEFLAELYLVSLIVDLVHSFGGNGRRVEDAGKLGSQQVTLFTGERRVRVDFSVEVTSEDVLYLTGTDDVLGLGVRELHPVVQQVVCYPVNQLVDTDATGLNLEAQA